MKKSILFAGLFLGSFLGYGQMDNYGTEFWTGFLGSLSKINGGDSLELKLYISAKQTTDVTISMPLLGFSQKINVMQDSVKIFRIPISLGFISGSEKIEKTGIHIVSDYPISVSALNLLRYITDATVVLPLKNIPNGPKYVTGNPDPSTNEILLVSPEDGVEVEIIPAGNTVGGKNAKTAFKVTLDKGQTYQVQSKSKLIGTTVRVLNNKKLMVYSGEICSQYPCGACDHHVEQIFPNDLLDTAYYVLPHFGHKKGYVVKVVSIDTGMWVKVNGKQYRIDAIDKPLTLDVPNEDSVLHISSSRKFSVFQFMKGANCNGYITASWGDPSILQILSTKYMGQRSTFSTMNSKNLRNHFVSIIIPTSDKNTVYLDASKIPPNEFIEISDNKDFSYTKIKLTDGVHYINCKTGHLAYCYGIGSAESYMYTAAFSLPNFEIDIKDTTLSFDCKNNKVTMRFESKLTGSIKSYHWDFGDGTFGNSKVVTHTYDVGKEFSIKLWAEDYNGKKDSVIKKYTFNWPEFNPVFDKLVCDQSFTFEEKNPFFKNFKWHDNSTKSSYTATKTEKIWVTATDTSGYCKFGDTAQVSKVNILSKVWVDTISNCHLNNLFKFRDSSIIKNDQILYKAWVFPGGFTKYDTSNFYYHFRQPGKYTVYLDVYPVIAACKSRIEIPVTVNWNTDIDATVNKDKFCDGDTAIIIDNSYSCCQKVKKYYWEIEGEAKQSSTNGTLQTRVNYDYKKSNGIKKFNYITETEQGCRDTVKSSLIVWPAAKAKFTMGPDSVKCLVLSRWTFTHTVDESLTGPYTMFWNFGNGKTGTQNEYKNFRYVDTGTYKVKLNTTTNVGCKDSSFKYVKVIRNPLAKFSVADSIQCLGNNSFVITDSSKGYDLKYTWKMGNGLTVNTKAPSPVHYDTAGKYVIKLKVSANYPGCFADSVTHKTEVLKHPQADFTINNDTQCFNNNSVILTDNSKFFNGKNKLYWYYNNLVDSALAPFAIHFSDTGTYKIILITKDLMHCADTISKTVSIKQETIVKMAVNDTVQCYGANNFTVESLQSNPIKSRTWTLNNKIIAGEELQKVINNLSPEGIYKVTLTEQTPFGCKDSISRRLEVLPPLKIDFSVNNDTQCFASHSFDFTNKSSVLRDLIKSRIYEENKVTIGTTDNIVNYKFSGIGNKTIQLKIETQNGCKDSVTHSIYLLEDPYATFVSDSVCLGEPVTLTAIQTKGSPLIQWAWNMDDGSWFDPITANFTTHTYKNAGKYLPVVGYKDKHGCYGSFAGAPVLIYPLPVADFSIKVLASDDQFSFVKLLPKNLGYSYYLWSFPDGSQNTEDTPTVKFSKFFKDRVGLEVKSLYGCSDTASQFLYIFPALTTIYFENAFTPNGDLLNETFRPYNVDGAEDYELRIYDRWGEQLFKTNNPKIGWNGTYKNEPVQLGVYIFTVEFRYADGNRYSTRGNVTVVR